MDTKGKPIITDAQFEGCLQERIDDVVRSFNGKTNALFEPQLYIMHVIPGSSVPSIEIFYIPPFTDDTFNTITRNMGHDAFRRGRNITAVWILLGAKVAIGKAGTKMQEVIVIQGLNVLGDRNGVSVRLERNIINRIRCKEFNRYFKRYDPNQMNVEDLCANFWYGYVSNFGE